MPIRAPRFPVLPLPRRQQGVVLVVSLVLLLVMLILGLASTRLVVGEERMAGQNLDRALAFQAAEAALREVETRVESIKPEPTGGCSDFSLGADTVHACHAPNPADTPRWQDSTTVWTQASPVGKGTLVINPTYLAEHLGSAFPCDSPPSAPATCKRYRITAKVGGTDGRAAVMVQSVYATD